MNVAMTDAGGFVEVQGTAEREPFSRAQLDGAARARRGRDPASSSRPSATCSSLRCLTGAALAALAGRGRRVPPDRPRDAARAGAHRARARGRRRSTHRGRARTWRRCARYFDPYEARGAGRSCATSTGSSSGSICSSSTSPPSAAWWPSASRRCEASSRRSRNFAPNEGLRRGRARDDRRLRLRRRRRRAARGRAALHRRGCGSASARRSTRRISLGVQSLVDRPADLAVHRDGLLARERAVRPCSYGVGNLVGGAVAFASARELGPMLSAVVVAGRTGAAIAAELGSMVVTEQIEALQSLGLSPTRMLVVPRLVALVVMLPLLTVLADIVSIVGGMWVASVYAHISQRVVHRRRHGGAAVRRRAARAAQVGRVRGHHRDDRRVPGPAGRAAGPPASGNRRRAPSSRRSS